MRKSLALFTLLALAAFSLKAAYIENVPRTLVQPNGDTLHCFVSGDEFYHYLHDADGFTIVQNPETGYFVYADKVDGRLVPTEFVAGKMSPQAAGLVPHLTISAADYQAKRARMRPKTALDVPKNRDFEENHGTFNNLVVFINFYGEQPFSQTYSDVDAIFNDSSHVNANSVYNYFQHASYHQLALRSTLVPQTADNTIVAYVDPHPRLYYEKLSASNPIGYDENDDEERTEREMTLLRNALHYVQDMIPLDLNLDYNSDGLVDNICFIVRGNVGDWADLLWPHQWEFFNDTIMLNGKRAYRFNFLLSDNPWYFSSTVMCHELFHSLGAPDLYHYADGEFQPVGRWDLMGSNANPPQHSGAYMKYRYGNWIQEIPTLTESGYYTVKAISGESPDGLAYIIPSEVETEFFVVECRKFVDYFESGLPDAGLLIYRIDTRFDGRGNMDWNGDDILDEIYVYRPGGTPSSNGDLYAATFRQGAGRFSFDSTTDPQPFLSDGTISDIRILDIHNRIDSATFYYLKPGDTIPPELLDKLTENQEIDIAIFPNPAHDHITITSGSPPRSSTLYDLMGRRIASYDLRNQSTISLQGLPAGTYLLVVESDGKGQTIKKIVVR